MCLRTEKKTQKVKKKTNKNNIEERTKPKEPMDDLVGERFFFLIYIAVSKLVAWPLGSAHVLPCKNKSFH